MAAFSLNGGRIDCAYMRTFCVKSCIVFGAIVGYGLVSMHRFCVKVTLFSSFKVSPNLSGISGWTVWSEGEFSEFAGCCFLFAANSVGL